MGKLLEFAADLLRSLLKPVLDSLLKQPWHIRLLALIGVSALALGLWNWSLVSSYTVATVLVGWQRVTGETRMPLTRGDLRRIEEAANLMGPIVEITLHRACGPPIEDAWSAAQASLAVRDLGTADRHLTVRTVLKNVEANGAWKQLPGEHQPGNIAVTAWIIYSLKRQDVQPPRESVALLLRSQSRFGWWPIFPGAEADSFAAIYPTAWCLLALNALRSDVKLPQALRDSAAGACLRARAWLLNHRDVNRARWWDYPYHLQRRISVSNSALILHALMENGAPEGATIARLWGEGPPEGPIDLGTREAPVDIWVRVRHEYIADSSIYFTVVPWVLVANEDAYEHCGTLGKIALTRNTRGILGQRWQRAGVAAGDEWIASETLLALRYLQCRHARMESRELNPWALGRGCALTSR